jgi:hypothetical protein
MLHRAFTSTAISASLIMACAGMASAQLARPTPSHGQHDWVGASVRATSVSSVYPGYGFSASERPAGAGGVGSTTPAAGATPAIVGQAPTTGAIAFSARRHDGADAIDITGTAPPGASVEITARATISVDLPDVLLNRIDVVADPSGAFSVILPIAPDYVPGTKVTIAATSSGLTPATATFVVGTPSSGPPITSTDVGNHVP